MKNMIRTLKSVSRIFSVENETKFHYKTKIRHMKNKLRYNAVPNPYETILINPETVDHLVEPFPYSDGIGRIESGAWDKKELKPVHEHRTFAGLTERFVQGKDWRETSYVKQLESVFADGGSKDGCETIDEFINQRCEYIDKLYTDIKNNGYTPNYKAGSNRHYGGRSKYRQNMEPAVSIGRHGDLFLSEGIHRFTIARLVGINMPVHVMCRHKMWQIKRDEVANSTTEHREITHPDLKSISK